MRILQIDNYDHCCFCNHDSTHFSILRVSANALYDYYSRIFDSFIFIHKSNRFFSLVKGYCVYMINKIIHGCLSLLLLNSKRNSISARAHVLFSISQALLRIPIIRLLHQYHAHFQESRSFDYYLSISRTFGISFIRLSCQYLEHFQDYLSLDCCVCISRTFRISFMRLPRQYLAHLQDSPSFDYYSISRNFRILFHWMITLLP